MAYADSIRASTCSMEDVATLIEGIFCPGYSLTLTTWTPTVTAGAGTWTPGTLYSKYIQVGKLIIYLISIRGTLSGSATPYLTYTLPVAQASATKVFSAGWIVPDASNVRSATSFILSGTTMVSQQYNGSNLSNGVVQTDLIGIYEAL